MVSVIENYKIYWCHVDASDCDKFSELLNISALKKGLYKLVLRANLGLYETSRCSSHRPKSKVFCPFSLTSHCVKSRLWISMIFTPSLTHALSHIFWKFDQNLWEFFLVINLWQFFSPQIFWQILSPNKYYQNRHILHLCILM